ncbi:MAG: hypothetical protein J0L92_10365 [Deltaproteobacteria bacterium]|nr:hypothetical protein [Deltaproteobacteria bacterium]
MISLTVGATVPGLAEAQCMCGCPTSQAPFFDDRGGDPAVMPLNGRVFARLSRHDPMTVLVTNEAGDAVDVRVEPAGDASGSAFWVGPTTAWIPGTYTIGAARVADGAIESTAFRVSAELDVTPPVIESLEAHGSSGTRWCASRIAAGLAWDLAEIGDDLCVAEIEVLDGDTSRGRLFARADATGTSSFGTASVECLGEAHVDGWVEGAVETVRVRVIDAAGNASEPIEIDVTPTSVPAFVPMECGRWCSVTAPGSSPRGARPEISGLVAAISWLGLRRRHRPR